MIKENEEETTTRNQKWMDDGTACSCNCCFPLLLERLLFGCNVYVLRDVNGNNVSRNVVEDVL